MSLTETDVKGLHFRRAKEVKGGFAKGYGRGGLMMGMFRWCLREFKGGTSWLFPLMNIFRDSEQNFFLRRKLLCSCISDPFHFILTVFITWLNITDRHTLSMKHLSVSLKNFLHNLLLCDWSGCRIIIITPPPLWFQMRRGSPWLWTALTRVEIRAGSPRLFCPETSWSPVCSPLRRACLTLSNQRLSCTTASR